MNQNGDEKRIRQLFLELSYEDQRRAPAFVNLLTGTESRSKGPSSRAFWPLKIVATAMLCLAVLIGFRALRPVIPQEPVVQDSTTNVLGSSSAPNDVVRNLPPPAKRGPLSPGRTRPRHRQFSGSLTVAMRSLSSWQSPTSALLQSPRDDMLNRLPRLGESLQMIRSFSLDQFN
jgi:hypothetical protein